MQTYEILLPETEVLVKFSKSQDKFVGVIDSVNVSGDKHHPYVRYNVKYFYQGDLKEEWFNESQISPTINQHDHIAKLGFR